MLKNKTYSIFCRDNRDTECKLAYDTLDNAGWKRTNENPDYIIVIGGDGSFLEAFHKFYTNCKPKILFINAGYLGFFAGAEIEDEDKALVALLENKLKEIKLDTLEIKVKNKKFSAINEIKLISPMKTAKWEVCIYVDEEKQFSEEVTGSGIVFSTALGSNGLSRSIGGSIVSPDLHIIHYLKVAPVINKATSSLPGGLVLQNKTVVKVKPIFGENIVGYIDNMKEVSEIGSSEATISLNVGRVTILTLEKNSFFYRKMKKTYNF